MKSLFAILLAMPTFVLAQTSKKAPEDLSAYILPLGNMTTTLKSSDGKNSRVISYKVSGPTSNKCKDNPNKVCGYSFPLEKKMEMVLNGKKISGPITKYTIATNEKMLPLAVTRIGLENAGVVDPDKVLGLEAAKDTLFSSTDKLSDWYGFEFAESNLTLNLKAGKFTPCVKLTKPKESLSTFACKGFGVVKTEDTSEKPALVYEAVSVERPK